MQFTRNPAGIAGALKKIGGLSAGSEIGGEHAAEMSHFYFAQGIESSLFSIFSTHPPLAERVKRLEPGFRGTFPEIPVDFLAPLDEEIPVLAAGFVRGASRAQVVAGEVVASVGTITADGINYAATLLKALPPELFQAARTGDGARAILLGMLFDARPEIRTIQSSCWDSSRMQPRRPRWRVPAPAGFPRSAAAPAPGRRGGRIAADPRVPRSGDSWTRSRRWSRRTGGSPCTN